MYGKRMKSNFVNNRDMKVAPVYTTPGATRHPLPRKGAWEAPFFRRGWRVAPGVAYKSPWVHIRACSHYRQ